VECRKVISRPRIRTSKHKKTRHEKTAERIETFHTLSNPNSQHSNLVVPSTPMSPRLHGRSIALRLRAEVIVILIPTTIVSMIRAVIPIATVAAVVPVPAIFRSTRLGAEAVDNALASSAETTRGCAIATICSVVIAVATSSARARTRAGTGSRRRASAPIKVVSFPAPQG